MHNLEDFRDKISEKPLAVRAEDLPFPPGFLPRTYAVAALGTVAICLTYMIHFWVPVLIGSFYEQAGSNAIDFSVPLLFGFVFFAVVIPMLFLLWNNELTNIRMFTMAGIYCFLMGTALAFVSFGSYGLIFPLLVCALTFAMLSGCAAVSKDLAQGKFSGPITFVGGALIIFLVHTIAGTNWIGWILSAAAVTGPCYLGINLQKLKRIAYLQNPVGLDEKTKSSIGGLTVLFNICVFLFPYVALFGKKFSIHRRWLGPEDR